MTVSKIALAAALGLGLGLSAANAEEYRMATVVPEASPYGEVMAAWAAALSERSGGEIDVNIFFGGALGDQAATLRQTQRGRLEAAGVSINALATALPEVTLMLEPYLFESDAVRHCVEDDAFGEIFGERLADAGYVIVGRLDIGNEHIWTQEPLTSLDQLAGLKISVPSAPSYERFMASNDASVTVLEATELVPGLQTGTVDAVLASAIYSILIGIPQLTGHAVDPGAVASAGVIGFSASTWDSFTPEQQELIQSTSDEFFIPFRQVVAGMEDFLLGQASEAGLVVGEMSAEMRAELATRASANRDAFLESMGGTAVADYAALAAAAEACSG